ncbi:hypothetical protein DEO72_LG5g2749 [Vigna unguiculata]|uniref:Uncharacterized protein n=1 Tax=Vigna unguiculata TaxID=3917 RepID=A0A4D6KXV6_VIGUN|nr:hypothetical protein DEO72_LG2g2139 [Vigna unguiculata]QCD81810.1 hypothetical protein DEO72_LG2g2140 [Vigna unguiculata]QCD94664.1 hypothetical protein DEO72_LG5g2749 [Vigna unguiculata]
MRRGRRWALSRCSGASRWCSGAAAVERANQLWAHGGDGAHGGGGVGEAEATCVKAIAKPATTSTRSVILKPANQKTKSVNIVATPADSQTTIDNRCCGREHLHCAAEPPLTQWLRFTVETR